MHDLGSNSQWWFGGNDTEASNSKFNAASSVCLQTAGRALLTLVFRPLQEIWAGPLAASRGCLCPVPTLEDLRGPKASSAARGGSTDGLPAAPFQPKLSAVRR